jgi:hypothetical protein
MPEEYAQRGGPGRILGPGACGSTPDSAAATADASKPSARIPLHRRIICMAMLPLTCGWPWCKTQVLSLRSAR